MTDIERVLSQELESERRRNEALQMENFNLRVELKKLNSETTHWRELAIATKQQLEALSHGEVWRGRLKRSECRR
jgi:hypothetical protein